MGEKNRLRHAAINEQDDRVCLVCGKPIGHSPRKTCSRACYEAYRSEQAAEGRHKAKLRRCGLPDDVIDAEVSRVRGDWGCDGSIADTPDTIYGNMISL